MFIYNRVNENFNNAGAHHKRTHLYGMPASPRTAATSVRSSALLRYWCNLLSNESVPGELGWITGYILYSVVFQLHTILIQERGEARGKSGAFYAASYIKRAEAISTRVA